MMLSRMQVDAAKSQTGSTMHRAIELKGLIRKTNHNPSPLKPVNTGDIVADFGDNLSPKSATVAVFGDSVDRALVR